MEEDDLSCVLNALPGLVWTAVPDGPIDFVNQRFCEYTGLSVDEACGLGWQTAIQPDDLPQLLERWRSILASGEPGEMEARLRRFDGEYRWCLVCSNPMRDAAGQKIVKWYGVITDIEHRKRAEEVFAKPAQIDTETRLQKIKPPARTPLNQNRQDWYTMANLTFESDFLAFRKIWPLLVLVRADPRVSAADFSFVYHSSVA